MITIPRFGRSNGAVSFTSRHGAIPTEQLRKLAPSIFAEDRHESRSERYSYIPTSAVLERLSDAGFRPHAVMQGGSRDESKRGFTKHVIRLRHDSQRMEVGGTHNEIVLLNSHDGTSSYRLMAGVYRLVCGNGLVVADSVIEDVRIPHKGDVANLVLDGCIEILEKLPEVSSTVRDMTALELSRPEQQAFAKAALTLRFEDEAPIAADRALTARRSDDTGSDLWSTFNRVQENLVRGGQRYAQVNPAGQTVAMRRTREVAGVDTNTRLNRALWTLAEEMRALKA